jgi:hypothetical protein
MSEWLNVNETSSKQGDSRSPTDDMCYTMLPRIHHIGVRSELIRNQITSVIGESLRRDLVSCVVRSTSNAPISPRHLNLQLVTADIEDHRQVQGGLATMATKPIPYSERAQKNPRVGLHRDAKECDDHTSAKHECPMGNTK